MEIRKIFKSPEKVVWAGFGASVVAMVIYGVLFATISVLPSAVMQLLCWLVLVLSLVGMAVSVWGMSMWTLLDTPRWMHYTGIGVSVVNILFPLPSVAYLLISTYVAMLG